MNNSQTDDTKENRNQNPTHIQIIYTVCDKKPTEMFESMIKFLGR